MNPDKPVKGDKPAGVEDFVHVVDSWSALKHVLAAHRDALSKEEREDKGQVDGEPSKGGESQKHREQYTSILKSLWTPKKNRSST